MNNKIVYISGPITHIPNYNKDAFIEAETYLHSKGYFTINPLRMNNVINDMNEIILKDEKPREYYLKRDIIKLLDCNYIYFLENWEKSKGAKLEKYIADELGIERIY